MTTRPRPFSADSSRPMADTLRRIWSTGVPDSGPLSLVSSTDKVVLGTGKGWYTDLTGSLVVLNAGTGERLRQANDHWQVYSLALSSDGRWLATSEHPELSSGRTRRGDADRIRILDVETGQERCRYVGEVPVATRGLAFSPDGLSVAAVGNQEPLVLDAADGRSRWRTHLDGASGEVAWSPDSASVAIAARDGVAVLDGRSGSQLVLAPSPALVGAVTYSRNGDGIVAGCTDGAIRTFAARSGAPSWVRSVSEAAVVSVAVSDDDRWVAGLSRDKVLAVYDLRTGTPRYPPAHLDFFFDANRVLFSPTLRHILAMDFGADTAVVDARSGRVETTCPGLACLIPPDGTALATAGYFVVERYDLGVAIAARDVGAPLTAITMSPTGIPLVAVADTTSAVSVIDAISGTRLAGKAIPGTIASLVFADQGQAVAAGGSDGVRLFSIVGTRNWKVDTIGVVNALAVAGATGEWIATAAGKTVQLLNSTDGHGRWPSPNIHPQSVTRVAASPDGRWVATGCTDRRTRILDATTGTETFQVEGDGRVRDLAFTSDSALLASANEDGTVVLVDSVSGSERSRVTRLFACTRIALSFDGALLAAAWDDNTVSVFDLSTGGSPPPKLRELTFDAPVSGLAFNPAEHTVAIAIAGASVAVYDARDGSELVRILQSAPVRNLAFNRDGALIATAGEDGVVRVWTSGSQPPDEDRRP